ncbi:MAG: phosphoribosylglycinamide formyltransferase 1 [Parcubacteria bacterium C7867-004]|nr:MAG: phosphoribosylglycinamide formyltransferase 1 [Parcubacteria bacterium C7867-004]
MAPRLLVFADGTETGGGSGFANLVRRARSGSLDATIVGVVSSHENGGVRGYADEFNIPFRHMPKWDRTEDGYRFLVRFFSSDFVALSGYTKLARGLDPRTTFNIHPGPLPQFGGKGMHGDHVHEAVLAAYQRGELTHTEVCMHFVTEKYDEGPVFLRVRIPIHEDDTVETLRTRVNRAEHEWQPKFTRFVMLGLIAWDGINPNTLVGSLEFKLAT